MHIQYSRSQNVAIASDFPCLHYLGYCHVFFIILIFGMPTIILLLCGSRGWRKSSIWSCLVFALIVSIYMSSNMKYVWLLLGKEGGLTLNLLIMRYVYAPLGMYLSS